MIGPMMFGNDRGQRRVLFSFRICAAFGRQVAGLKNLIWFVIAVPRIDRANDRELVEHRRLFRQMLADDHSRQLGLRDAEGAAIVLGTLWLTVPGVDVAWTAGHPEQDATLRLRGLTARRQSGAAAE